MPNTDAKSRKRDSARLIWDTKPRRAANPKDVEFQTAEVVIPNPQTAGELPLSFRDSLIGEAEVDKQKMNRLIWGDNLLAMQALLAQGYEGKIDLIYIDPPFDSKADYSHALIIEGNEIKKEPSVIERLAYKDTWAGGTDSYLDMLYPRLQLMKRLLSETGSIWVHTDWHVGHYIKVVLDEIFGKDNFQNEIVWKYTKFQMRQMTRFAANSDRLLWYAKRKDKCKYFPQTIPLAQPKRLLKKQWDKALGRIQNVKDDAGRVQYIEIAEEKIDDVWEIPYMGATSGERTNYDTQKPKALLRRLIQATSAPGDLVADFFAGCGTTGAVAESLDRRWIMCELGKVGIQVTRGRLVEENAKPFLIENIGNYQREMIYLTGGRIWEMQHLILKLYGAMPRDKTSGLGVRMTEIGAEELVYVGYPDRSITARKAEELAVQAQKLDGRGYKCLVILGWDYEYNYHQALEARLSALSNNLRVHVESRDIPPDIYDYLKSVKSEDDIGDLADKVHFYERPYLRLEKAKLRDLDKNKVEVSVAIKRYVLQDIPISRSSTKGQADYEALMKLAKDNFSVLVDYWAIDWDYDGFTFRSEWQAFRGNGKKAKTVPTQAAETLEKKKKRTIAVRVVDIFGNDAGATIEL